MTLSIARWSVTFPTCGSSPPNWRAPKSNSRNGGRLKLDDAEFERQKQRLLALAERWVRPLGLGWWDIQYTYARDDYEPPQQASSKDHSVAHCSADWRYGHACITWNMPLVREQPDETLERVFVHELQHIFLHEMRWTADNSDDSIDHEERVASIYTKAFLWLRDSLTEHPEQPPTLTEEHARV